MSFKNTLYNTYKNLAEKVIPELKDNNFLVSGMLTLSEFQISGNHLIELNPSWRWNKEKNMLVLPFIQVKKVEFHQTNEEQEQDDTIDQYKWNIYDSDTPIKHTITKNNVVQSIDNEENDSDEYDFSDFEIEQTTDIATSEIDDTHKSQHFYDVSITYDHYYRTPRIWFFGVDYTRAPLKESSIFKDFSVEHMKVSATLETHPITELNSISVHPCKHADAMKKMFKFAIQQNKDIKIESYLLHFLKFVSCIIPHLCFDFVKI